VEPAQLERRPTTVADGTRVSSKTRVLCRRRRDVVVVRFTGLSSGLIAGARSSLFYRKYL